MSATLRSYAWVLTLGAAVLAMTAALLVRSTVSASTAPPPAVVDAARSAAATTTARPDPGDALCATRGEERRIVVSVSAQHLWLCEHGKPVRSSPVTTGRSATGHGTPIGSWRIVSHETARFLEGPGYRVRVRYWLPFVGDVGFHDSPWQRFPYGDRERYKTRGSQGCVHVPEPMMAELYRWTTVGTAVTVAR